MKRIALVTGGAGFIGSHLCEELLTRGYRVFSIDDLSTGNIRNLDEVLGNPHFKHETADMTVYENRGLVAELVDRSDVIYHLAAAVGVQKVVEHPGETIRTNLDGTERILEEACKKKKRVLIASTSEVYGKNGEKQFREDDDILLGASKNSRWCYAASKLMDEFMAFAEHRENGLPVTIVRFFNTVGPRQSGRYGMVIPRFIDWALKNQPIQVYGTGTQSRCFCYVKDSVDAVIRLTEAPLEKVAGQLYNVGNPEEVSMNNLAKRVKSVCNSRSKIIHIPYEKAYAPGFEDMQRRMPCIDKIGEAVGWTPRFKLDEILEVTKQYSQS